MQSKWETPARVLWEKRMAELHGCRYVNGICEAHGAEKPKKGENKCQKKNS